MSLSFGIPEGWHEERRPLQRVQTLSGWDYLELPVVCRGEHLETCQAVNEGWICDDACPVEDMRMLVDYPTTVDTLVEIRKVIHRVHRCIWGIVVPTLTVEWSATRISDRTVFKNGRRRAAQVPKRSYVTAYRGTARTKRAARHQMKAAIQADQVVAVDA